MTKPKLRQQIVEALARYERDSLEQPITGDAADYVLGVPGIEDLPELIVLLRVVSAELELTKPTATHVKTVLKRVTEILKGY